jgi:hypothetical protein
MSRRRAALLAAAAMLLVAVAASWLLLGTPRTLQAQVQQALARANTAHVVISSLDEKGVRRQGEVWYERGRGFRAESPDEVILDDGRHQWTWQPGAKDGERVIARRPSQDAVGMIAGMFQLGKAPATWGRERAAEHDRAIDGRPCRGFVVTPPTGEVMAPDGSGLVPELHPPRFVVLTDPDDRVVSVEEQRFVDGRWQAGRQIAIAYDVKVPAEKLAVHLPPGRVVDADRALADRFPLDRALARGEADGLLFAVHEAALGEDDTVYVVSSVRGTPEYLKAHPPQRRRLNLQTTMLDVAQQVAGSVDQDCHRAALATAEKDGVHYLWWLVARRHFFTEQNGLRQPAGESPSLEVRPGTVRVPLQAFFRGPQAGGSLVQVSVEVALPGEKKEAEPLGKIAARARRDVLLLRQAAEDSAFLYGCVRDGELRPTPPADITDANYARGVRRQLDWLRSCDKVTPVDPRGLIPPREPDRPRTGPAVQRQRPRPTRKGPAPSREREGAGPFLLHSGSRVVNSAAGRTSGGPPRGA